MRTIATPPAKATARRNALVQMHPDTGHRSARGNQCMCPDHQVFSRITVNGQPGTREFKAARSHMRIGDSLKRIA